jgi:hypothetical protein
MVLLRNRSSDLRFSNCSRIVWNGVPISCYRKTTYQKEGEGKKKEEDFINSGYGYDFGDWKSYPTPKLSEASGDHKEFAAFFNSGKKQMVASRTCSDMNFTPELPKSIKLLILTADDSPNASHWQHKIANAAVCVSDATRGGFVATSNSRKTATHIPLCPFIQNELSCIVTQYYGDI